MIKGGIRTKKERQQEKKIEAINNKWRNKKIRKKIKQKLKLNKQCAEIKQN